MNKSLLIHDCTCNEAIIHRDIDGYINATFYLKYYNKKNNKNKVICEFFSNEKTKHLYSWLCNIKAVDSLHKTKRGNKGATWMDKDLFSIFYNWINNIPNQSITRDEICFVKFIQDAFSDVFTFIPQKKFLDYYVDLYCPQLNLCIEFDEGHHFLGMKVQLDKIREESIRKKFNVEFIRHKKTDHYTVCINNIIKHAIKKWENYYKINKNTIMQDFTPEKIAITPTEQQIKQVGVDITIKEFAFIDEQIAYAQKNRRQIDVLLQNAIYAATFNYESAESCIYNLPLKTKKNETKMVSGKSVHLARILAQNWGNLRVSQRKISQTDTYILVECAVIDLENNLGIQLQLEQPLPHKCSKDLIRAYEQAAFAIVFRNAILSIIPKYISDKVYDSAINYMRAYMQDEKYSAFRENVINKMHEKYGINDDVLLRLFDIQSIDEIRDDKLFDLIGVLNNLKEGNITADELIENSKIISLDQTKKEKIRRLS